MAGDRVTKTRKPRQNRRIIARVTMARPFERIEGHVGKVEWLVFENGLRARNEPSQSGAFLYT